MDSLEKYREYKDNKKIQNIISKKKEELEKRKVSLEEKKQENIKLYAEKQSIKYEKLLRKIEKNKLRELDKQVRKVAGKKPLKKKMPSEAKRKEKAYQQFQKFCKLIRMDKYGYVVLADTWEKVFWNKCQWWHYYSKRNYPQLAFELDNVHPITWITNRLQWDNTWVRWKDWIIKVIGINRYNDLEDISLDKWAKFECAKRDWSFYDAIYTKYKKLNENLLSKIINESS